MASVDHSTAGEIRVPSTIDNRVHLMYTMIMTNEEKIDMLIDLIIEAHDGGKINGEERVELEDFLDLIPVQENSSNNGGDTVP